MKDFFQIVYGTQEGKTNEISTYFKDEACAMLSAGINIGIESSPSATRLLYRGNIIKNLYDYPNDPRFIHTAVINENYLQLSKYYPLISDLTIETYFFDQLNIGVLKDLMQQQKWEKVFIKKGYRSLEHVSEGKSVYPDTTFDEMMELFDNKGLNGKYAVRKFMDKKLFEEELRYWVLNGKIYRHDNIIPHIVKEAAKRLNELGGKYYTIDATPEFIVEVNPGESSDRHAENSAELFASWFKKEFILP